MVSPRPHPIEGNNSNVSATCARTTPVSKQAPRSCRRDHQVRSLATAMADATKAAATKTPIAISIFADSPSIKDLLVIRTIQMIQQIPLLAFPAKARIHFCRGHRLSPVKRYLSEVLHRRVNRVNDSEH